MKWNWVGKTILGILILFVILAVLFPATLGHGIAPKVFVKNDERQLVVAIKAYYTEYGYYPKIPSECVTSDSKLLSVLMGTNSVQNPKKIVFLEVAPARKKDGRVRNGIQLETGTWLDAYGNAFLIKIDTNYDSFVPNPYKDVTAGPNPISTGVIVWSAGKDGIFGNPKAPGQFQGSDDIVSWQ